MKNVIDLFSGCGGFSLGFERAGFKVIKAVEFDNDIAESYMKNHPNTTMINEDIKNIDNDNYFIRNEAEVIIGGPPCQGFSMAGSRIRSNFISDDRNYLFEHYLNIVKIVKPKIFIMENVRGILNMEGGLVFKTIKSVFSDSNNFEGDKYYVHYKIVNSKNFGTPQNRERVIIIGILNNDFNVDEIIKETKLEILNYIPSFFDKVTIKDAIGNLPKPNKKGLCDNLEYINDYEKFIKSNKFMTYNHVATNHSKKSIDRMKKIKVDENFHSLDETINSVHSGSYGRLNYNGLSQTITTRFDTPSGGKFIHPEYNRTITPREAARIQGFPDDFEFIGSKTSICKQIGNAVPIKISYFFAIFVRRVLNEYFN